MSEEIAPNASNQEKEEVQETEEQKIPQDQNDETVANKEDAVDGEAKENQLDQKDDAVVNDTEQQNPNDVQEDKQAEAAEENKEKQEVEQTEQPAQEKETADADAEKQENTVNEEQPAEQVDPEAPKEEEKPAEQANDDQDVQDQDKKDGTSEKQADEQKAAAEEDNKPDANNEQEPEKENEQKNDEVPEKQADDQQETAEQVEQVQVEQTEEVNNDQQETKDNEHPSKEEPVQEQDAKQEDHNKELLKVPEQHATEEIGEKEVVKQADADQTAELVDAPPKHNAQTEEQQENDEDKPKDQDVPCLDEPVQEPPKQDKEFEDQNDEENISIEVDDETGIIIDKTVQSPAQGQQNVNEIQIEQEVPDEQKQQIEEGVKEEQLAEIQNEDLNASDQMMDSTVNEFTIEEYRIFLKNFQNHFKVKLSDIKNFDFYILPSNNADIQDLQNLYQKQQQQYDELYDENRHLHANMKSLEEFLASNHIEMDHTDITTSLQQLQTKLANSMSLSNSGRFGSTLRSGSGTMNTMKSNYNDMTKEQLIDQIRELKIGMREKESEYSMELDRQQEQIKELLCEKQRLTARLDEKNRHIDGLITQKRVMQKNTPYEKRINDPYGFKSLRDKANKLIEKAERMGFK